MNVLAHKNQKKWMREQERRGNGIPVIALCDVVDCLDESDGFPYYYYGVLVTEDSRQKINWRSGSDGLGLNASLSILPNDPKGSHYNPKITKLPKENA